MGRPPRHDADRLLDAAADLVAASGPRSVTVAAVARTAGAPSGSVYHRFPGLPALLAALWVRTVERYQEGLYDALRLDPPGRAVIAASRHTLVWSREHPRDARILLYSPADFDEPNWPPETRERLRAANRRVLAEVRALGGRMGLDTPEGLERLYQIVADLPLAVARRHLSASGTVPGCAETMLVANLEALLAGDPAAS
ncbi:TetR/AcrR family transcriptional regulator [Actinomadura keratinilytica]|jgi:AcrR family transcriptional regulator|uniref:TetR/AcrR family transcriptional regulator n=1 Tax=Actinomadura keratinilytica TaxID=547461 RepID=A0ABP7YBY7_9ACTN